MIKDIKKYIKIHVHTSNIGIEQMRIYGTKERKSNEYTLTLGYTSTEYIYIYISDFYPEYLEGKYSTCSHKTR